MPWTVFFIASACARPIRDLGLDIVDPCLCHLRQPPGMPPTDRHLSDDLAQDQLPRAVEKPVRGGVNDRPPSPRFGVVELLGRLGPTSTRQTDDAKIGFAWP
jgi:hypothetical protein